MPAAADATARTNAEHRPVVHRRRSLSAALAALALLMGADLALGPSVSLPIAYVLVPFVAAIWSTVAATALIAALALVAGLASAIWNMHFGEADYLAQLAALLVGGGFAVVAAGARQR